MAVIDDALKAYKERWLLRPGGDGAARLDRRHVYILPTRHGWLFGALLLAVFIGAVNYSNSLAFMLTFLLAALGLVAMLHTYRNLLGLRLAPGRVEPLFAGGHAHFTVRLESGDGTPRRGLRLEDGEGLAEGEAAWCDVSAGRSDSLRLSRPAIRRGRLALGRFRVESDYPLGLFRAWSWLDLGMSCVVYPAPEPPGVPLPATIDGEGEGSAAGQGEEDFAGLRAYRPGDPLRHVAWKAVAKGQPLLTKQFDGAAAGRLQLEWDSLAGLHDEARLARLCRWVLDAEDRGMEYGLRLPRRAVEPARGPVHRAQCLEALALHGTE